MSDRRIVDTNLVIRHLAKDHPEHERIANDLFVAAGRGELVLILLPAVVAECVFVLESFYKQSRDRIADSLSKLLSSNGVEAVDIALHQDALDRYKKTRLHFVDCVIAAAAAIDGIPIATFDRGFLQLADIRIKLD